MSIGPTWAIYDFYKALPPSAAVPEPASVGRGLAAIANILPAMDWLPITIYNTFGLARSLRGTIVVAASLVLCSANLVSSTVLFPVLERASHTGVDKRRLFQSYYAVLCLHCVDLAVMLAIYMRRFWIPGPDRLPKTYKPFAPSSSGTSTGIHDDAAGDGPLATLFAQQQEYKQRNQQRPHLQSQQRRSVSRQPSLQLPSPSAITQENQPSLPAENWPRPLIPLLFVMLFYGSMAFVAVHIGIQFWRYATCVADGYDKTKYYGGQWRLVIVLGYPFTWIPICGTYIFLFHMRIAPESQITRGLIISDIPLMCSLPAIILSIIGIVSTFGKANLPPLARKHGSVSPGFIVWVLVVIISVWLAGLQLLLNPRILRLILRKADTNSRVFLAMEPLPKKAESLIRLLIDLCVLDREDRYPGRHEKKVELGLSRSA
ncbi:hypothetical protein NKR23_g5373 [Pleurostoma richardsiae]|uniref:Uncharacterized protein n=1 Tax=Pleurostoma richardsiae TaxID=41990 RepID=A0AA38VQU4_9PEZI|nr:hypothetical protein NKR23_g5373 [Pleurostoma richardsiae]